MHVWMRWRWGVIRNDNEVKKCQAGSILAYLLACLKLKKGVCSTHVSCTWTLMSIGECVGTLTTLIDMHFVQIDIQFHSTPETNSFIDIDIIHNIFPDDTSQSAQSKTRILMLISEKSQSPRAAARLVACFPRDSSLLI